MFTDLSKGLCLSLLSVILLISYSSAQSPDHWFWKEKVPPVGSMCSLGQNDFFDSVFMLSGDTFFKINGKIYRMNSYRLSKPYKLLKPWKTAIRVPHIESAIGLDLNENIYAFDYQFYYQNICIKRSDYECDNHWIDRSFVCLYGFGWSPNPANNRQRETRVMSYDLNRIQNLTNPTLETEVKKFCQNQFDYLYIAYNQIKPECDKNKPMTGWSYMNFSTYHGTSLDQYFVCRTHESADRLIRFRFPLTDGDQMRVNYTDYHSKDVLVLTKVDNNIQFAGDWWKRTHLIVPINFDKQPNGGGDIVIYNCGGKERSDGSFTPFCSPQKSLTFEDSTWFQLPPHPVDGHSIKLNEDISGMNIYKLLRCPNHLSYQVSRFNPNHFCRQKSFKSIFNLGADIYFQAHSRIWRYDRITPLQWFTDDIMPTVRYDSYTTSLLRKYFRLDLIIFGLTLRVPEKCNSYTPQKKRTKECEFLAEYQHRLYITCLFGYDKTSSFQAHPFIKTIAGIKDYPKDHKHYKDVKFICNTIGVKGISKTWNETLMPIGVIDYKERDWKPLDFDPSYCCYDAIIHYLRFYNRKRDKDNNFTITRDIMELKIWMKDKPDSPRYEFVEYDYLLNVNEVEAPLIEGGVFTTTRIESSGYFYKRNADLSINSSIPLYLGNLYYNERRFDTNSKNITILQLFNCSERENHFQMRYSLVPIKDSSKLLCKLQYPDDSNIPFSVFNIGEYVYFQNERQFFRYIPERDKDYEQGFYYDKQVSELLNDIFDTSERVVGFSFYEGNDKQNRKFRVTVMGKPNGHYQVRFNTNVTYYVFHKERGAFAPLTSIHRNVWFSLGQIRYDNQMVFPVGAVHQSCTDTFPLQNCTPPFVVRKSVDDSTVVTTVDAMGFLQSSDNFINEYNPEPNNNSVYPSFWAAVIDNTEYHESRHGGHLFYQPWFSQNEEIKRTHGNSIIERVYGIYSLNEKLYVVGLSWDSKNELKIFQISDHIDGVDGKETVFVPKWNYIFIQKYDLGKIHQVFKCDKPIKFSRNPIESKSSTAMVLIFICLIIVLVILLIIVGFMAYKRFESNKQTSEDVKQKTSKNQSKNENKSSSESAMSSKTLRNEDINTVS